MVTRFTSNPVVPINTSVQSTNLSSVNISNSCEWVELLDRTRLCEEISKLSENEKALIFKSLLEEYVSNETKNKLTALLSLNKDYNVKYIVKQMLKDVIKTCLKEIDNDNGTF